MLRVASAGPANTALQDAGLLCRLLSEAATETAPGAHTREAAGLIAAIGGYEAQMRQYGYAAVMASRQAEAGMNRRGSAVSWLTRQLPARARPAS